MKAKQGLIIIDGGVATDDRGRVRFVNDFDFKQVRRFYQVENHNTRIIRAWHGHRKEAKYVYVARGAIILGAVKLTDYKQPSKKAKVERLILSAEKPQVVYIPPGYANGFRALTVGTIVIFFSTATLTESTSDDYRFPYDYWGKSMWQAANR
ncbi:sugar epimerase [Microgenomates group bacterium RBG_16_45_19]|nr:MAG: sugar epimerase [Microgenomates group bacterium RBG_16_45_19]